MYYKSSEEVLKSYPSSNENQELMILVGQGSKDEMNLLMEGLKIRNIKFFGGIYPKVLSGGKAYDKGFVIKTYKSLYSALVFPFLLLKPPSLDPLKNYTGIIIGDGFSSSNNDLIQTLSKKLPSNINYIGGGSAEHSKGFGSSALSQKQVVFNNNGFFKDAVHLVILENESKSEIQFGWEVVKGPFLVTKSKDNIILELDDDSAFEQYRFAIEEVENVVISKTDFVSYSAEYTFGLIDNGHIEHVRVPIEATEEDGIRIVNHVDEGTQVYLIRANSEGMLNAVDSFSSSLENITLSSNKPKEESILFTCITRDIYFDEEFDKELALINQKCLNKVEGAVTIGEFFNGNGMLTIYEGACVLSRIYN